MLLASASSAGAQRLGVFTGESDVGHVRRAGATRYDRTAQQYEIAGSGQNMWGDHDDFHFVWR